MTPQLALRISAYLLVADGVAALFVAGLVGPMGLGLVAGALALAWWRAGSGRRIARLDRVLVLVVAAVATAHVVYVVESALDGFVSLLLLLVLLRLGTARSLSDLRDAGLLSFFMLVAASSMAFGVSLLFAFVGYLVLGSWMLMLHHVVSESERADQEPATSGLFRLSVVGSLAAIAITAALFFVIPRVGQASLPMRAEFKRMLTGFTSQVELGAIGEIETDTTVVMRVSFPEVGAKAAGLPGLRWRGIALDQFDGRGWTASRPERRAVRASPSGVIRVANPQSGWVLTQEVFLEPIGTDVIFAAPRVLSLRIGAPGVLIDDTGALSVAAPAARLSYTVESELEARGGPAAHPPRPLDPAARERYLQLPVLPPRIPALAQRIAAGSADDGETARRLTTYLSRELRYSLVQARTPGTDALEDFLFIRRSGNCEYFATALAVMLRTVGMPARVVNGFQRGEWNPYGEYLAVRLSDAHSWVEAWIDGAGWVSFDASPRDESAGGGRFGLYFDALRMRWYRYVVNWSLKDQVDLAASIRHTARRWRPEWPGLGAWPRSNTSLVLGLGAAVAFVVAWRWRRGDGLVRQRVGGRDVPEFYRRALRMLSRRGVRPAPHETAREFRTRIQTEVPAWSDAADTLTSAYERVRFGNAPLTADERAALARCLIALRTS